MVEVAVRDENLVRAWVDLHVARTAEARHVVAVRLRTGLADLKDEFALARELQEVPVLVAVPRDPDEPFRVDVDAVLVLGPVVARAGAAPGLDQVALLVELQDGRSRRAALRARRVEAGGLLVVGERARTLDDPDVILRIDGHARGLAHNPS